MHERISVNNMCFMRASHQEQADFWRDVGARCVSFMGAPLLADGLEPARNLVKAGDIRVETIAHGPLTGGHLSPRGEGWDEGRRRLSRLIQAANELGGRSVYMLTGGHGDLTWEEAAECFCSAIAPCVAEAKQAGVQLMIENSLPLYADFHIAHSIADALTLAEMADVGVCLDLFGCWTEAGLQRSLERAMPRCHLIQVSDYVYGDRSVPSRAVPGDGNIPLKQILDWALCAGYTGVFDLELLGPRIDQEGHFEAVRRTCDNLGEILHSLGA